MFGLLFRKLKSWCKRGIIEGLGVSREWKSLREHFNLAEFPFFLLRVISRHWRTSNGKYPWCVWSWALSSSSDQKISWSVSHFLVFSVKSWGVSGFEVDVRCPGHICREKRCFVAGFVFSLATTAGDNTVNNKREDWIGKEKSPLQLQTVFLLSWGDWQCSHRAIARVG